MKKRKVAIILIAILIFALTLRLTFFTGRNTSDDPAYVRGARQVLVGGNPCSNYYTCRTMMIYGTAASFALFGISEFSAALFPLICSMLGIVLIFLFGRMLFNERVGLLAAFLLSFFPLDVLYATRVMPDVPLAFFMALSVYLFLLGENSQKKSLYLLAGFFWGIAYLVKATGLILFSFYIAYFLYKLIRKREINRNHLLVIVGFLLVLSSESMVYHLQYGDALHRFTILSDRFTTGGTKNTALEHVWKYYPSVILNYGESPNLIYKIMGYFYYLIIPAILYLLLKRPKNSDFILIWLFAVFLYMQIGTSSVRQYVLFTKDVRFLSIIAMPSILILARFLGDGSGRIRRIILPLALAFLLITSFHTIYLVHDYFIYGMGACGCIRINDLREIHRFSELNPDKRVYVRDNLLDILGLYSGYENDDIRGFRTLKDRSEIGDSFVVVNTSPGFRADPNIPEFIRRPPADWTIAKTIGGKNGNLNRSYNPVILYVPKPRIMQAATG